MLLTPSSMEVHSILVGYVMVCLGDIIAVHVMLSYKFSVLSQTKWIV